MAFAEDNHSAMLLLIAIKGDNGNDTARYHFTELHDVAAHKSVKLRTQTTRGCNIGSEADECTVTHFKSSPWCRNNKVIGADTHKYTLPLVFLSIFRSISLPTTLPTHSFGHTRSRSCINPSGCRAHLTPTHMYNKHPHLRNHTPQSDRPGTKLGD